MKIGLQTWGSEGDILPFLALAGGLRARGHEVSLVITSVHNKDYSSYGKEMDIALSHVGKLTYDDKTNAVFQNKIIKTKNPLKQTELVLSHYFYPVLSEMFDAAKQLCINNDVIIGHFLHYPVQTAAESVGKHYVTVNYNHAGIYSKYAPLFGAPNIGNWMNPLWRKLFHFFLDRSVGSEVNKLRKKVGLPPVNRIGDSVWVSRELNLFCETTAICHKQRDWPDYHHVCGIFTIPNAAKQWATPADLTTFLEAGPPPIFMTLGSMFSLDMSPEITTSILVQGALLAGCRAIVQAPWDKFRDIPDHPDIYRIRQVPYQYIFPSCSAVVHHGGAGTTHSAMLYRCPSVVIEHFGDQSFFASELHRLGVAPKMLHRRNITARKLALAIRTVLDDPSMKERAEDLSQIMLKEDGVVTAAELIEDRFSHNSLNRHGNHRN